MSFKVLKDHAGLAAIVLVLGWNGAQVTKLVDKADVIGNELVAIKRDQSFVNYRLDQQRDQVKDSRESLADLKVKVGRLEVKVFGFNN